MCLPVLAKRRAMARGTARASLIVSKGTSEHPIGKVTADRGRSAAGQAGLADAAWPREREPPHLGAAQERGDLGDLTVSPMK